MEGTFELDTPDGIGTILQIGDEGLTMMNDLASGSEVPPPAMPPRRYDDGQLRSYPWTAVGAEDTDERAIYVRELDENSTGPAWPWPLVTTGDCR